MLKQILIAVENAGRNYCAYAPEVPGCISVGSSVEETKRNMAEALEGHFAAMVKNGEEPDLPDDDTIYCLVPVRVPSDGGRATGETLRNYRKRSGLTQEQMAAKLEVTKATISEWERGARELPGTVKYLLEAIA